MKRIMSCIHHFMHNTKGQIAPIMALSIIPLVSAVGLGVDYAHLAEVRAKLQNEADVAALERRNGSWSSATLYNVTMEKDVDTYFMGIVGQNKVKVAVTSQTYVRDPEYKYIPPQYEGLSGGARNTSVMGVYCYDEKTNKRSQFADIADNRGNPYPTPDVQCKTGEKLEYYLMKHEYPDWVGYHSKFCSAAGVTSGECDQLLFMTDNGSKDAFAYPKQVDAFVETVLCDSMSQCIKPKCEELPPSESMAGQDYLRCPNYTYEGGRIPSGANRQPHVEKEFCAPGKYMYYGWENFSKSNPKSDRDFNDAVMVFSCPEIQVIEGKHVYLVR